MTCTCTCTCMFLLCPYHVYTCTCTNVFHRAGEGGKVREHKTSLHAIGRVVRSEGILGLYNG